jgi:hypothetical protein
MTARQDRNEHLVGHSLLAHDDFAELTLDLRASGLEVFNRFKVGVGWIDG